MKLKKVKVVGNSEEEEIEHFFVIGSEVIIVQDFIINKETHGLNLYYKHCYGMCYDSSMPRTQIIESPNIEEAGFEEFPDVIVDEKIANKIGFSKGCVAGVAGVPEDKYVSVLAETNMGLLSRDLNPVKELEDLKLVVLKDRDGDAFFHWIPDSYLEYV